MAETKYVSSTNLAYYDSLVKGRDAQKSEIPKKLTDLNNDGDFVRDASYRHTDNNFTDAEKTKLAGIAAGAQANVIEAVTVNGKAAGVTSKNVNITVPTDNASLENGAGYQTASDVETAITGKGYRTDAQVKSTVESYGYQTASDVETAITGKGYRTDAQVKSTVESYGYQTAAQVQSAVTAAGHLKRTVVSSLPETGDDTTIYLVPASSSKDGNVKDEYMWIGGKWERIGSSETDLTGYVKATDLAAMTTAEIDAVFA